MVAHRRIHRRRLYFDPILKPPDIRAPGERDDHRMARSQRADGSNRTHHQPEYSICNSSAVSAARKREFPARSGGLVRPAQAKVWLAPATHVG